MSGGVRRGPRQADNFTIISNAVLNDDRLSFRARGVLMWLLSKPADWRTRSEAIARQSPTEGRDAIRTAMRELEQLGYLVREKRQDERGRWHTEQTIFEEPVDSAPTPEPGKSHTGRADVGESGALTRIKSPRTETNNNRPRAPRQHAAHQVSSLSEKVEEIHTADAGKLADLESATVAAGLPASYGRVRAMQRSAILELIDQHGIPELVAAARSAHRDSNPTLHVNGWLRLWQALPVRQAVRVAPKCGKCDEYGWLPDDAQGRAVRCSCRTAAVA
ncbi:replication protein [Rhodococcus sp. D2-41]|uniref:replication protein n=1 Tax=Speluncibacter jeojiensis TaxID=2710754 RepID=UPI00240F2535|nr:replication protein [Rhodococcus sp. D2-41]MDG3011801.1 replication protein [Rhodococcus sp. D2-41]